MDDGVIGHHRYRHVRRVGGDASVAGAEGGKHPVGAGDRRAARAGLALVAVACRVAEIHAARPLEEIARRRRGVAQLGRGAGEDCLRQRGIALAHLRMMREIAVARSGADGQIAVGKRGDAVEAEAVDVDQAVRVLDVKLHQIDKGGAAGEKAHARALLRCG